MVLEDILGFFYPSMTTIVLYSKVFSSLLYKY